jgi:hypothetical protein
MADFLLLYGGGGMPEGEQAQAKVMEAWGSWFQSLGDSVKDPGNPFGQQAKTIGASGDVSDGAKHSASGYSIIKASSLDDAVGKAKGCPVLSGGANISVFEIHPAM